MPNGPAPSCEKARMRTPASGSAVLTLTEPCSYIPRGSSTTMSSGAFQDVIKRGREPAAALPVDEFLGQLDRFIADHNPYRQNKVIPAIGCGRASLDVVKRYAKE